MRKKGQAELIGLAFVVVLLIFALVFFAKINSNEDNTETRLIRTNLRANSALNAIMKVSVGEKQMKDLIEECYRTKKDSCNRAYSAMNEHLEELFEEDYYLVVLDGNTPLIYAGSDQEFKFGVECRNSLSASPFIFRGDGRVEFKICT